jgi:Asp-tRNA(Asn)/Glu-tRNA(Gln) amidotransferase A subunit family amidase
MSARFGTASAIEIVAALRDGATSAVAIAESALGAIARVDQHLNCFTAVTH